MIDAISRRAAIDLAYCAIKPTYDCPSAVSVVNVEDIENLPALDVQPVIFCKDCTHARPLNLRELMVFDSACFVCTNLHGAGTSYPEYEMTGKIVCPKDYCSYAHRRENGR